MRFKPRSRHSFDDTSRKQTALRCKQKREREALSITDNRRSYGAANADQAPRIEHRQHTGLNNRVEASRLHTRRRKKIMGWF